MKKKKMKPLTSFSKFLFILILLSLELKELYNTSHIKGQGDFRSLKCENHEKYFF